MSSQEQATSPATLLSQLRQHLGLDTEYTVDHDDGFTWWPNGTPIRFRWAGPRAEAVAIPTSRISFEIDAIEGIDVSEEQEAAALSFLTKTFNLFSSAVEDGTLRFRGTAHLLEGGTMAPVARLFNQAFFASHLIATKTSDIMPLLAPKNRGLFHRGGTKPVTREHPANGVRRNASDIPASSVQSMLDAGAVTTVTTNHQRSSTGTQNHDFRRVQLRPNVLTKHHRKRSRRDAVQHSLIPSRTTFQAVASELNAARNPRVKRGPIRNS